MKEQGYRTIAINPFADEILGEKCYKRLIDLPEKLQKSVEIVDIFRPAADVPPIMEQTTRLKEMHGSPHVVWMQLGIVNEILENQEKRRSLFQKLEKYGILQRCVKI